MRCYKCGVALSGKDYCSACGADVTVYKKIINRSNILYNDGLSKAKVRDLSGAIVSLKRSLKYNKNNIQARNLLGLVYFEVGETVAALGEWIISTNIQPEKNIADGYMKLLSANQGKLDSINQTIKKYNLCLSYCKEHSYDLAIIQLNKLLSVNTHLVQGYQLLALLYIQEREYEKAYKQLKTALKIDKANTTTLYFISEITDKNGKMARNISRAEENVKIIKKSKDKVEYHTGNDLIIQPTNIKENNGLWTILNIVVGLVIGIAVTGFLILPAKTQVVKNKYKSKENQAYEELQEKKAEIDQLNKQISDMQIQMDSTNSQLANYEGDTGIITGLINLVEAEKRFNAANIGSCFEILVTINRDSLPEAARAYWQEIYDSSLPVILEEAQKQYKKSDNPEAAINYYNQILSVDGANEEALFGIAAATEKKGSKEEAIQLYNNYLAIHPAGNHVSETNKKLAELQQPQ